MPRPPGPPAARQSGLREANLALVLRTVCGAPEPLSRAGVAAATSMTRSTVSRLVDELVGAGVLDELDRAATGPGRPATPLVPGSRVLGLGLQVDVGRLAVRVVDLRGSAPDVIMTTAKKLQAKGWKRDQPWIEEVRVPDQMPWDQTGRTNKLPLAKWAEWGVTRPDGSPLTDNGLKAGIVLPMGRKGPAFLSYDNFDVYLEWNQSFTYALTTAVLASRFAGAPAYDPRNPDPGLNQDQMKQLQTKLEARGYDVGTVDGILGTNTREAVRKEQQRLGLPVDGWPTAELLGRIANSE